MRDLSNYARFLCIAKLSAKRVFAIAEEKKPKSIMDWDIFLMHIHEDVPEIVISGTRHLLIEISEPNLNLRTISTYISLNLLEEKGLSYLQQVLDKLVSDVEYMIDLAKIANNAEILQKVVTDAGLDAYIQIVEVDSFWQIQINGRAWRESAFITPDLEQSKKTLQEFIDSLHLTHPTKPTIEGFERVLREFGVETGESS